MMLFVDARLIRKRDVSGVVMRFDEDDVSEIKCAIRMGADNDRIVGAMICAAQEEGTEEAGFVWFRIRNSRTRKLSVLSLEKKLMCLKL